MKQYHPAFIATLVLLLPATSLATQGIDIDTSFDVALKRETWDFSSKGKDLNDINADFTSLDFLVRTTIGGFFIAANYDTALDADIIRGTSGEFLESDRKDSSLTLGYGLPANINIFGGYKYGQTEIIGEDLNGVVIEGVRISMTEKGPFVGASYFQRIGKGSGLGVSTAYAFLDGLFKIEQGTNSLELDGDTKGFSYGIFWTGTFSQGIYYKLGYKLNRYEFKTTLPSDKSITNNEDMNIFQMTLSFDLTQ